MSYELSNGRCFNPRPRMRANSKTSRATCTLISFNPRPRMRANHTGRPNKRPNNRFQSAPPYEGERSIVDCLPARHRFNPRPRMRANVIRASINAMQIGFNPRPRMRANNRKTQSASASTSFNPRPRMRANNSSDANKNTFDVSIRAPV